MDNYTNLNRATSSLRYKNKQLALLKRDNAALDDITNETEINVTMFYYNYIALLIIFVVLILVLVKVAISK